MLELLNQMDERQLNMNVLVSAGCDENGNAEFYNVDAVSVATSPDISAGVPLDFDRDQPIILFEE